ncbi:MAG: hypothetical protein ACLPN5_07110, partial [Roseiarcus sp.]
GDQLTLTGSSTLAGTVSGPGTLVTEGAETVAGSATISIANWKVSGSTATLTTPSVQAFGYLGHFEADSGAAVVLGGNFVVAGGATFNDALLKGQSLFVVGGSSTIANLTIQGASPGASEVFQNSGALTQQGLVTLGLGSTTNQVAIQNGPNSSSTWDIVGDYGITYISGGSEQSPFLNAGLFEKTAGTGTSDITAGFINNGTIEVSSGTLEFANVVSGTGGQDLISGASDLDFGWKAAGQSVSFAGAGGTLELGALQYFAAGVTDFDLGGASGDTLLIDGGWTYLGASEGAASTALSLQNGATQSTLTLSGDYQGGSFAAQALAGGKLAIAFS